MSHRNQETGPGQFTPLSLVPYSACQDDDCSLEQTIGCSFEAIQESVTSVWNNLASTPTLLFAITGLVHYTGGIFTHFIITVLPLSTPVSFFKNQQ